jgi:hypothetical protein
MATSPMSADAARYILDVFVRRSNCRPGDVLSIRNFHTPFFESPWQSSDFKGGMEYAAQQGWVDVLVGGDSFRITELGFSEAGEGEMNLAGQCNETVTVEQEDGSRHEDVRALVTEKMILIPDPKVPIAPNDAVLRQLPSGLVERLVVTDPGFHARIHGIPEHYQVKYRREGRKPEGRPGYVVHVSGNNPRVNIKSTDNSTNSVIYQAEDMAKLAEEFAQLRAALLPLAHNAEHYAAIGAVASAEMAAKEGASPNIAQALSALGAGGKWVLDAAKDIGVPLAVAALKSYLDLPPG